MDILMSHNWKTIRSYSIPSETFKRKLSRYLSIDGYLSQLYEDKESKKAKN